MKETMTRREALRNLGLAAGTLLVARSASAAVAPAAMPHVAANDPTAIALGYHEDGKKVDTKAFANFKPEQKCSNCLQSKGKDGDAWLGCNLFPGKMVAAGGWCKVYVKKP